MDESFEDLLKPSIYVKEEFPRSSLVGFPLKKRSAGKPSAVHGQQGKTKRSFKDYTKPIKRGFLNRQIAANDIRRQLAQVVITAVNQHDAPALTALLAELCGPCVLLTSRFIGVQEPSSATMSRELHGISHIVRYLDALFVSVPDALLRLITTKVHMFQNGCSYIVGKFTLKGVKCFDLVTVGDVGGKVVKSKFDRSKAAAARQRAAASAATGGKGKIMALQKEQHEQVDEQFVFEQQEHGLSGKLPPLSVLCVLCVLAV